MTAGPVYPHAPSPFPSPLVVPPSPSKKPRKSKADKAAAAAALPPPDPTAADPDTWRALDPRPETSRDDYGPVLERAGIAMVAKRFEQLLAASDPATLREYAFKEHMAGAELRAYETALGEFMHLYGSKMQAGAGGGVGRGFSHTEGRELAVPRLSMDGDCVC